MGYKDSPFDLEKFKRNMFKNKFTQKQAIDLIKSGLFTIVYHDNGYCCLYEGKYDDYEDIKEDSEVYTFEQNYNGYIPEEVAIMVKILKGNCETV